MKRTIRETIFFMSAAAVVGKLIAPFIMLSQCSIVMRSEIYNMLNYLG